MRGITKFALVGLSLLSAVAVGFGVSTNAAYVDNSRDCNKYSVIRCGTMSPSELRAEYQTKNVSRSNGSTKKQSDIPAVFSALGISANDLNGSFHKGIVYKSGVVKVNGKTVAKNAVTGARHLGGTSIRGSKTAKIVSVSKMGSAQAALVKLNKYGQFMFAVMTPCGNPVKATNVVPKPKPKPVYSCNVITKSQITRNKFSFNVKTSVSGGAKNKSYTYHFGDGTSKTVSNGSVSHTYTAPGKYTVQVIPTFVVNGKLVKKTSAACKVTIEVKPAPVAVCKDLSVQIVNRNTRKFVAKAEAKNGAKINSYVYTFGDGKTVTNGTSVSHTYAKPGHYTAKVTVKTSVGDRSGKQCQAPVDIAKPKTPSVKIEKAVNTVEHTQVKVGENYTYELVVSNNGEVDLTNVKVTDPAPANVQFVSASAGSVDGNVFNHTIPSLKIGESQKFIINAKVTEYFEGNKVNTACVDAPQVPGSKDDCDDATVDTVEDITVCDLTNNQVITIDRSEYDKDKHTKDLSKCKDIKVCDLTTKKIVTVKKSETEGNDRYTTDYDKCKPEEPKKPETPVTELPKTGIADTFVSVIGLGSLVTATYYYVASRRAL